MDVPAKKDTLVNVVIKCFDTDPQFRVSGNDHVRRLPLGDQRGYNFVKPV